MTYSSENKFRLHGLQNLDVLIDLRVERDRKTHVALTLTDELDNLEKFYQRSTYGIQCLWQLPARTISFFSPYNFYFLYV